MEEARDPDEYIKPYKIAIEFTGSFVENSEWKKVARKAGKRLAEALKAGKKIDSEGNIID